MFGVVPCLIPTYVEDTLFHGHHPSDNTVMVRPDIFSPPRSPAISSVKKSC
jgi:hypothetical protein